MIKWLRSLFSDLGFFFKQIGLLIVGERRGRNQVHRVLRLIGGIAAFCLIISLAVVWADYTAGFEAPPLPVRPVLNNIDFSVPVRDEPRRFKARTHMPRKSERAASGSLDHSKFLPKFDLVRVDDRRVWWESEHDRNDTEDDHIVHRAMEIPLRRLIELTCAAGGTLKVQDAYRDEGIHALRSLHKEGRAVDVTCDELGLEKLAKLCWAAGFDWVYYEVPKRGGTHVHASVRSDLQ